jgi:hypothetical protein
MKTKSLIIALVLLAGILQLSAQGTAFTYQGHLNDDGSPANGTNYGMVFYLYDASTNGSLLGNEGIVSVTVSNGLFTVPLDFGNKFDGNARWLEIAVQKNGGGFTTLAPRQPVTPAPYALFANTASNVSGTISASQLSGSVPLAQLPTSILTNGASGVNITGTFSGNAGNLTNVNINTLTQTAGLIVAWGNNDYGEANIPTGLNNVVAISAGYVFGLALQGNGTVVAWGYNNAGQTAIPAGLNHVVAIAAGDDHSLALQSNGTVVGWGDNSDGATTIPAGLNNVVAIAASGYHSLALQGNGTVVGWGDNSYGQTNIPAGLSNVTAIAAGFYHSLALQSNGTVVGWGNNGEGETTIPAGLSNVTAIAAGFYHNLALQSNGTVVGWGNNGEGETTIPTGLSNVTAIAAGFYHSLALQSNGTVVGWGDNSDGETTIPTGLSNVVAIAAGYDYSLSLQTNTIGAPPALLIGNNVFTGSITATGFSGDGSGLTNLNAANLTGTIPANNFLTSILTNFPDAAGPLPATDTFTSQGGRLIITTDGSGSTTAAPNTIGMNIQFDGVTMAANKVWANNSGIHVPFISKTIIKTGVAAGTHTIKLVAQSGTLTDVNDTFTVTVQELPY